MQQHSFGEQNSSPHAPVEPEEVNELPLEALLLLDELLLDELLLEALLDELLLEALLALDELLFDAVPDELALDTAPEELLLAELLAPPPVPGAPPPVLLLPPIPPLPCEPADVVPAHQRRRQTLRVPSTGWSVPLLGGRCSYAAGGAAT